MPGLFHELIELGPGELLDPIETSSGHQILQVAAFDDIAGELANYFADPPVSPATGETPSAGELLLMGYAVTADVSVNPRYGALGRGDREHRPARPAMIRGAPAMITIVGLGPGGTDHVTAETLAEIERHEHRFVRTTRHPSAHLVGDAVSFDDVYEAADRFEDVYAEIVDRLVAATAEHGDILYAVPGSPLVLERTVRALLADDRGRVPGASGDVVPRRRLGPSAASTPSSRGCDSSTATSSPTAARGEHGPMLVAHTHANWVLSDIKLAAEQADGDEPVTILQGFGTEHERVVETTWSELDRTVEADHLTCIYVPRLGRPVGDHYVRFHELTRTLREQCPWDREQTHQTLVPYLVEEAFELVDALQNQDPGDPSTDEHVIEELGDLLYHIEFHAAIAEQEGRFSIVDIADGVHDKLVRRHPHVFAPPGSERVDAEDADAVLKNWDEIKRHEKQRDVDLRRRADRPAGARPRAAVAAQGGEGRLRLGRRRRPAGEDPRGARRADRGDRRAIDRSRSRRSSATCCSPS